MIMEDEAPNEAHEHASNQAQSNARNKEQNEQHNEQQNEQQNEHQNEQQNEHQVQQDNQELEELEKFTAKKIPQPRSVERSSSGLKKLPQVSAATSSGNHPWIRQRKEHLTFNDDDDDSDDDYVLEFN